MPQWYEKDDMTEGRIARGVGYRVVAWTLALLVIFALFGGLAWGFKVLISDVAGRGDAVINKNTGINRVQAQEQFEKLYAEIQATDRKLPQLMADKKEASGPETRTRYSGAVNYCQSVTGQYNALARSYSAQDFRAFDLPAQIDPTDSTTDCKD